MEHCRPARRLASNWLLAIFLRGFMTPIPHFPENDHASTPNLFWLRLTKLVLDCALAIFTLSKSHRGIYPLEVIAVRTLRLACRALGHAPAASHLEFRADLPVQI